MITSYHFKNKASLAVISYTDMASCNPRTSSLCVDIDDVGNVAEPPKSTFRCQRYIQITKSEIYRSILDLKEILGGFFFLSSVHIA